eukprot:scaffold482_cov266-Amphora_coffeaeformis.AAC.1
MPISSRTAWTPCPRTLSVDSAEDSGSDCPRRGVLNLIVSADDEDEKACPGYSIRYVITVVRLTNIRTRAATYER